MTCIENQLSQSNLSLSLCVFLYNGVFIYWPLSLSLCFPLYAASVASLRILSDPKLNLFTDNECKSVYFDLIEEGVSLYFIGLLGCALCCVTRVVCIVCQDK